MLLLRQSPHRKDFQDELLAACIRNLAYDPQCEDERSRYLADLILATGEQKTFFSTLLAALENEPGDEDPLNRPQIFAILVRLALAHPDLDADALRAAFSRLKDEEDRLDCLDSIVQLDGLSAFLDGVQQLASDLEDRWWRVSSLLEILRARDGVGIDAVLTNLRPENRALDQLMVIVEEQNSVQSVPTTYDFDEIRTQLQQGSRPGGAWVSRLTDTEWSLLAEDFATVTDQRQAILYLRLFGRRGFPHDPQLLFRWAEDQDASAARAALFALGRVSSPAVRALALRMIETNQPDGARLLRSNFESGDFTRLEHLLHATLDQGDAHDLGLTILDLVSKQNGALVAKDLLLQLYERTPCSRCRADAVEALAGIEAVPPWMAEECRFDADSDAVKLFDPPDGRSPEPRP